MYKFDFWRENCYLFKADFLARKLLLFYLKSKAILITNLARKLIFFRIFELRCNNFHFWGENSNSTIFQDADVFEEDIEELLNMGEKKTQEENKKLEALGESSLRTFTLDTKPEDSVYNFEGEDFKEKQREEIGKKNSQKSC